MGVLEARLHGKRLRQPWLSRIFNMAFSTISTLPATNIGGTWERIENKALVALGDTPAAGDHLAYSATGDLACQFVYAWQRIN